MGLNTKVLAAAAALILLALAAAFLAFRGGGQDEIVIQGGGSTFAAPQVYEWARGFSSKYPEIKVNYASVGSGSGVAQFLEGTLDFASSDPPLDKSQWSKLEGEVLQMPVLLGAVSIVYNLPGLNEELRLNGETLALIYLGEISYWNDERIARLNPDIDLPEEQIIVVYRSDSSGTTQVFTYYLYKSSGGLWPESLVGKTIDWPVAKTGRGIGGKGNEGVTQVVKNTPYSIGYVELSYALENQLPMALLENREGNFVKPAEETIASAALNALKELPDNPLDDWSPALDSIIYTEGENSYPLTSFTFFIFRTKYSDEKIEAIKLWIEYINTEGQDRMIPGYIPIPKEIASINLKALEIISRG
ncbi:MAG: phosphate ABC transporter substrate-binding protein PstS [Aeropyrum sp.]|nr:phosphate ABC transporter substrate-binding protein PstS [Aeropyrum sp.]MCE4615863.1 phosphate ABC transporter substrate-binding protein PstS [Aeropyrum sp.]